MKSNKNNACSKGGVKIHETNNTNISKNATVDTDLAQIEFYNNLKKLNKHTGVRITQGENEYKDDPFSGLSPFNNPKEEGVFHSISYNKNSYDKIDLNINNYSREDLFTLFGLTSANLTEHIMKECKKTVLKTHPDKSRLDEKYFIFFSKAYKKLLSIYEFQNKTKKTENTIINEYYDKDNVGILDKIFEKHKFKDPSNFNEWFNDQFEKHKLEDPIETGYGEWLKSNEDIVDIQNVTKSNMTTEMEKHKRNVKSIVTYNGITDYAAPSFGGSSLMEYKNNFTSNTLFSNDGIGYTDLRQAYVESVIPVTEDDFQNVKKFNSVDEYKRHRETNTVAPFKAEEAMKQLYHENKLKDEESTALAFYYAQQAEKAKKNQQKFWSKLKQLDFYN